MEKMCFVIQKFDGAHYDQLYNQIFDPAIRKAGLVPYRVDRDPAASISRSQSLRQNADAAKTLSIAPSSDGLRPHELLALTIVFQYHYENGVPVWTLMKDMEKGGYTKPATTLALTVLRRKGLVESREVFDSNDNRFDSWFVTESGEEWLLNNQDKLHLVLGPEISEDDIPF